MGCFTVLPEVSSQNIRHTHIQIQVQNTLRSQTKMTLSYSFSFYVRSRICCKSLKRQDLHPASSPAVLQGQHRLAAFKILGGWLKVMTNLFSSG